MKKTNIKLLYLFLIITSLIIGGFYLTACANPPNLKNNADVEKQSDKKIEYYTCPMHHQIHADHPGSCPICGMTLVPVYATNDVSTTPATTSETTATQALATVEKKVVEETIHLSGEVAFDRELQIAEEEYLIFKKNAPDLVNAAKKHLQLLGVSNAELKTIQQTSDATLSDATLKKGFWVYATLFQSDADKIHVGDRAMIQIPNQQDQQWEGLIQSIDPVVDVSTRTLRARIFVKNHNEKIKPNQFVTIEVHTKMPMALVIPRNSVIDTGEKKYVFLSDENGLLKKREIKSAFVTPTDVGIALGLNLGDRVATDALFLVDSESQL